MKQIMSAQRVAICLVGIGPQCQVITCLFVVMSCRDINNINDTNVRTWLSGLGPDGVEDIIVRDNAEELTNSAVLNPDFDSNFERNQGVEYLAVETVFELITHGGFLPRRYSIISLILLLMSVAVLNRTQDITWDSLTRKDIIFFCQIIAINCVFTG